MGCGQESGNGQPTVFLARLDSTTQWSKRLQHRFTEQIPSGLLAFALAGPSAWHAALPPSLSILPILESDFTILQVCSFPHLEP